MTKIMFIQPPVLKPPDKFYVWRFLFTTKCDIILPTIFQRRVPMSGESDSTRSVSTEIALKEKINRAKRPSQSAREVVLRVYDRFVICGPDSRKQIPVGLVLGDRVEILVGMFPRDVSLIEVLETARVKRDNL